MEEIGAEQLASQLYQEGISNFEGGNYQQAIALLERARALAIWETGLGGDITIWLANSYDAIGNTEDAITLCRSLNKHPVGKVRKSARYMLGILTAPQLSKLEGVISEVPILQFSDSYQPKPAARKTQSSSNQNPFREVPLEKPNTDNNPNNFLWFAIATALVMLALWAKLT
ncbi:MAG: hypothetical protein DCF19_05265 [Pseudanabaena frigida]|uniref:Outer membrane protein assembly factor BamD n=1 Tax=Pseudanabaena frigida TaxID=945775 RepID=A0A2W4WEP4_9CYAN|nr:MAG: hypothetical protein DCF19_05265 [Pseudanabaena frigida]